MEKKTLEQLKAERDAIDAQMEELEKEELAKATEELVEALTNAFGKYEKIDETKRPEVLASESVAGILAKFGAKPKRVIAAAAAAKDVSKEELLDYLKSARSTQDLEVFLGLKGAKVKEYMEPFEKSGEVSKKDGRPNRWIVK